MIEQRPEASATFMPQHDTGRSDTQKCGKQVGGAASDATGSTETRNTSTIPSTWYGVTCASYFKYDSAVHLSRGSCPCVWRERVFVCGSASVLGVIG